CGGDDHLRRGGVHDCGPFRDRNLLVRNRRCATGVRGPRRKLRAGPLPETLVWRPPFREAMPSYRIPSDDRVRDSLVRVFSTRPMVDSQRRLKQLVEKDLKGDEKYRVGVPRLRVIAIDLGLVDLQTLYREP